MKYYKALIVLLSILLLNNCTTLDIEKPRIACVGDSITEGIGVNNPNDSYPSVLQRMVGDRYKVKKFSVPGSTAAANTGKPYINTHQFKALGYSGADITIIILGTNDSVQGNFDNSASFVKDYKDIIAQAKKGSRSGIVYACTPPRSSRDNFGLKKANLGAISRKIKQAAAQSGCRVIDLHNKFIGDSYFVDGIHPNKAGYQKLAQIIYNSINR